MKNNQLACLLVLCLSCFIACKKPATIDPALPVPSAAPPLGEVFIKSPNIAVSSPSARGLFITYDNKVLVSGMQGMPPAPGAAYQFFPMEAKLRSDFGIQYYKESLVKIAASSIVKTIEVGNAYYSLLIIDEAVTNRLGIVKTDTAGNVIWQKRFNATSYAFTISESNDGSLLVQSTNGGYNFVPIEPNPTVIMKIDTDGNLLWRRDYTAEDLHYGGDNIVEDTDGSLAFIAMRIEYVGTNVSKVYPVFCKTNAAGNIIIKKELDPFYESQHFFFSLHLARKRGGGYILTHEYSNFLTGGGNYSYYFRMKLLSANGDILKSVDLNNVDGDPPAKNQVTSMIQARDGSIYVVFRNEGNLEWFTTVLKFDETANFIKRKLLFKRPPAALAEDRQEYLVLLSNHGTEDVFTLLRLDKELEIR